MASGDPWYQDGLRFECSTCGNCCSGPSGTVHFDEEEGRRMAEALGLGEEEFLRDYTEWVDDRRSLKEVQAGERTYDCIFLDRESRPGSALCRVYRARPAQCSTWPFWPRNLQSESNWYWVKRNTPCPGMDRGDHFDRASIEARRSRAAKADPEL